MRGRDNRHSRLAAEVSGLSEDSALRFLTSRDIIVDWPDAAEQTLAGRALIKTAVNLIIRFAPCLKLRRRSPFAREVAEFIMQIDSSGQPYAASAVDPIIVQLGGGANECHVSGSADGWTALVSGKGDVLPAVSDTANVLGAHAAAALVASEVFRHALPLAKDFQWHSPKTRYSLFDYGSPRSAPPDIEEPYFEDTPLLAGVGAIGQACIDTLASLRARGAIRCVDRGYVDDETNLNRSVLALERDVDEVTPKVSLASRRLVGSDLTVLPHCEELATVLGMIHAGDIPWPRVVASALDTAEDRRLLQQLWPDTMLDAATGGSMAQVFRHVAGSELACLRCLHADHSSGLPYEEIMALRTGLSAAEIKGALSQPSVLLDSTSLNRVRPEIRELAEQHLGLDICGFLSAVEHLGQGENPQQVLVSVSFSSYFAGVLLAAELVKAELGIETQLVGRYQIDPLKNLDPGTPFAQQRRNGCFCTTRERQIRLFRDEMAGRR